MNILIELEDKFNLKPIDMARELGISKSYYTMLRKEERDISKNVALKLKSVFGIQLEDSLCLKIHKL